MKELFDKISEECSKNVTKSYSTSFSLATKMLSSNIRQDIYNIYGFVRFADEIVDDVTNAVVEPSPVNASNVNVLRVSSNNDAVIEPAAIAVFSVPGPKPL